MSTVMTLLQLAGLLAVLAGVALALPLALALIVGGVLVLLAATLGEYIVRNPSSGPSAARSGRNGQGVA